MDQSSKDFVLQVIDGGNDLTLATGRDDGYPQATTVSFAHDGLDLYVGVGQHSQKANNIRHNNKVSLTINLPYRPQVISVLDYSKGFGHTERVTA